MTQIEALSRLDFLLSQVPDDIEACWVTIRKDGWSVAYDIKGDLNHLPFDIEVLRSDKIAHIFLVVVARQLLAIPYRHVDHGAHDKRYIIQ